jgi:beta-1,4-N-acetylglucosaminyltransferase
MESDFMRKRKDKIKICVACSTGGHLVEVKQLEPVYKQYEHFFFTFRGGVADELKKKAHVWDIPNVVRRNPLSWLTGAIMSLYIAFVERPDVVITTGAGIVVFFCVFAKLFGAKLIFIESMARVERPTLTARMLYPFTDLFFVQWPGLLKFFPRAKYSGRVF